ncbi:MAG: branched-chain amino acid ABC transporter permease [Ferrimicrobium sp.]
MAIVRSRKPAAPAGGIAGTAKADRGPLVWALIGIGLLIVATFVLSSGQISILESVLIMAVFAVSTNIVVGYSGLVTFGQSLFYGVGAYTLALGWYHYKLPFWMLFILAPILGAIAAVPVGLIALRTRRWFFALVTLAFTQLVHTIVEQAYSYTQGATGIFGNMVPQNISGVTSGYLFIALIAVIAIAIMYFIMISPFGVTLKSIRENRRRAAAVGVNVYKHQLIGFVISGAGAGIAGALLVVQNSSAYPHLFNWLEAGNPLLAALVGGIGSFMGPVIGAVIFEVGKLEISQYTSQWELVLGIVLVGVVLLAPDGLIGLGGPIKRFVLTRLGRRTPVPEDAEGLAAHDVFDEKIFDDNAVDDRPADENGRD